MPANPQPGNIWKSAWERLRQPSSEKEIGRPGKQTGLAPKLCDPMATIFSHAVAAASLGTAFPQPKPARFWIYGMACSMVPDVDVIGFRFGIRYGDMLGHRGLTHSI